MTDVEQLLKRLPERNLAFDIFRYLSYKDVYGDLFQVYWKDLESNGLFINLIDTSQSYWDIRNMYRKKIKEYFYEGIPTLEFPEAYNAPSRYEYLRNKITTETMRICNRKMSYAGAWYGVQIWSEPGGHRSNPNNNFVDVQVKILIYYIQACYGISDCDPLTYVSSYLDSLRLQ